MKQRKLRKKNKVLVYRIILLLFYFIIFLTTIIGGESTQIIESITNRNNPDEILLQCKTWLSQNTKNPNFFSILMYYFSIEEDLSTLIVYLRNSLDYFSNNSEKGDIYFKIASLEELEGKLSLSQQDYTHAMDLLPLPDTYIASLNLSNLLYEQGFYQDVIMELNKIPNNYVNDEIMIRKKVLETKCFFSLHTNKNDDFIFDYSIKEQHKPIYLLAIFNDYIDYLINVKNNNRCNQIIEFSNQNVYDSPEYSSYLKNLNILPMLKPSIIFDK